LRVLIDTAASVDAMDRPRDDLNLAKFPEDLARYEVVLKQSRPELVIECGTWRGGSALWFAAHDVDVVTIDVVDEAIAAAREHPRVTRVLGDSESSAVVQQVAQLTAGRRTMVTLDSDHHPFHVRREIELYGPFVSPGCYLVVEDGLLRFVPSPFDKPFAGPLDAIELLLKGSSTWVRDERIEAMSPISSSPAGWWTKENTRGAS